MEGIFNKLQDAPLKEAVVVQPKLIHYAGRIDRHASLLLRRYHTSTLLQGAVHRSIIMALD